MVTEVVETTGCVVTLNAAVVLPAGTRTDAGAIAKALLLDNDTDTPPAGAALLRETVPIMGVPPAALVGFTAIDESETGATATVSTDVLLRPL